MIGFTGRVVNAKGLRDWANRMPDSFARRAGLLLTAYALKIEKQAKLQVPVRTANLRSSIHTDLSVTDTKAVAKVGTKVEYAPYVEYGTGLFGPKHRRFIIRPRFKKALAWPVPVGYQLTRGGQRGAPLYRQARGQRVSLKTGRLFVRKRLIKTAADAMKDVVVRKVIHPGVRPRPYLIPPFRLLLPSFRQDLKALANLRFPRAELPWAAGGT